MNYYYGTHRNNNFQTISKVVFKSKKRRGDHFVIYQIQKNHILSSTNTRGRIIPDTTRHQYNFKDMNHAFFLSIQVIIEAQENQKWCYTHLNS